ncbi:single-stranded DNA-binding protein [Conexibacter sp. DBS9H8]|uniref:single-stranded DNA-binding protein n=1 Tax=Conexibacter sp. DBS9H8 TaxID=2937801 RepID=UPI002010138B|nr:single-stranded DNA-binding protein [Conexibacter sp. DBS9H8]
MSNHIHLIGRLTADPELKALANGNSVCHLRLAVDGMAPGRETGYINVSTFGASGEAAARTLTKGWLVAVDGRLEQHAWEKNDERRTSYAVVGNVEFLAAPRASGREQEVAQETQAETETAKEGERPSPSEPGFALRAERLAATTAAAAGVGVDW